MAAGFFSDRFFGKSTRVDENPERIEPTFGMAEDRGHAPRPSAEPGFEQGFEPKYEQGFEPRLASASQTPGGGSAMPLAGGPKPQVSMPYSQMPHSQKPMIDLDQTRRVGSTTPVTPQAQPAVAGLAEPSVAARPAAPTSAGALTAAHAPAPTLSPMMENAAQTGSKFADLAAKIRARRQQDQMGQEQGTMRPTTATGDQAVALETAQGEGAAYAGPTTQSTGTAAAVSALELAPSSASSSAPASAMASATASATTSMATPQRPAMNTSRQPGVQTWGHGDPRHLTMAQADTAQRIKAQLDAELNKEPELATLEPTFEAEPKAAQTSRAPYLSEQSALATPAPKPTVNMQAQPTKAPEDTMAASEFVISSPPPKPIMVGSEDRLAADAPTQPLAQPVTQPVAQAAPGVSISGDDIRTERHDLNSRRKDKPLWIVPAALGAASLAILSVGGAAAIAFWQPMRGAEIPFIVHSLENEKVIPGPNDRGGYEVEGLGLSVLERDAGGAQAVGATRAAPGPERPVFASELTALAQGEGGADSSALSGQMVFTMAELPGLTRLPQLRPDTTQPVVAAQTNPAQQEADAALAQTLGTPTTLTQALEPLTRPQGLPSFVAPESPTVAQSAGGIAGQNMTGLNAPMVLRPLSGSQQGGTGAASPMQLVQLTAENGVLSGPGSNGGALGPSVQDLSDSETGTVPGRPIPSMVAPTEVIDPWGLQLAALSSPDSARRLWQNLRQANLRLLGDVGFSVESVVRNGRQLYRLRIGPFPTRATALDVCAELQKAEGQIGCIPITR